MNHPTITRPPDLATNHALAWKVPTSDVPTALGSWLVYCPGHHAFWHTWGVNLIHLRGLPGIPPAFKHYPAAQFELVIMAVDPASSPDPDHPEQGFHYLTPPDFCHQFDGVSDATARQMLDFMVKLITEGKASPDSDYQENWKKTVNQTLAGWKQEN